MRCGCGYSFDPSRTEEAAQDLLICTQEEQLYEQYLAARVEQTREVCQIAEAVCIREPLNKEAIANLSKARRRLQQAREELLAQSKTIAKNYQASKKAKKLVSSTARAGSQVRNAGIKSSQIGPVIKTQAIEKPVIRKKELKPDIKEKVARKIGSLILRKKEVTVDKTSIKETNRFAPSLTVTKQTGPERTRQSAKPAIKATGDTVIETASKILTRAKPARKTRTRKTQRKQSAIMATPSNTFKAAQAAKASAILQLAMKVIEVGNGRKDSVRLKTTPPNQKKLCEPDKLIKSDKFTCPHCTATHDINTTRCGCGYQISSASAEIPGLALDDADRELFNDPASIQITKFG
ncbi:MAG: hypothetical protein BMS9Abin33_0277 [Gammaproteobacteria bacterium]|nr:MAG: hypothetical protein BMS9Abin33_0277 [Gammaproteobacteria bacterium]